MALDPFGPSAGLDPSQPVAGLDPFAPDPNAPGPFKRGFGAGVAGVKSSLYGAGALAAHGAAAILPAAVAPVATGLEQAALANAQEQADIAAAQSMQFEDVVNDPTRAGEYFKFLLGNALPSLATMFVGGAAGRGLGALAGRGLAPAAAATAKTVGMNIGAVAPDVALEAGGIYPEALKTGVENPATRAAVGGAIAASADFVPLLAAERYLKPIGKGGAGAILKGAVKGAPVGAALEGSQELVQSVIERAAAGNSLTDPAAISDYINSFLGGAAPGSLFGAGIGGRRQTAARPEIVPNTGTIVPDSGTTVAEPATTVAEPATAEVPPVVDIATQHAAAVERLTALEPSVAQAQQEHDTLVARRAELDAESKLELGQRRTKSEITLEKRQTTEQIKAAKAKIEDLGGQLFAARKLVDDLATSVGSSEPAVLTEALGTSEQVPTESITQDETPVVTPEMHADLQARGYEAGDIARMEPAQAAETIRTTPTVDDAVVSARIAAGGEPVSEKVTSIPEATPPESSAAADTGAIQGSSTTGTPTEPKTDLQQLHEHVASTLAAKNISDAKKIEYADHVEQVIAAVTTEAKAVPESYMSQFIKEEVNKRIGMRLAADVKSDIADHIERETKGAKEQVPANTPEGKKAAEIRGLLDQTEALGVKTNLTTEAIHKLVVEKGISAANKTIQQLRSMIAGPAIDKGYAKHAAAQMTENGIPTEAVHHPVEKGKFLLRPIGEKNSHAALTQETFDALPEPAKFAAVDAFNAVLRDRGTALRTHLTQLIGDRPELKVETFQAEPGDPIGSYTRTGPLKAAISMALNAKEGLSIADHEGYHYAEDWLLTSAEKRIVANALKPGKPLFEQLKSKLQKYDRENHTSLTDEVTATPAEARAYGFEFWRRGELKAEGALARVWAKLKQFFERVANKVRGLGFTSMEDVFTALDQGQMAEREAGFSDGIGTRQSVAGGNSWYRSALTDAVSAIQSKQASAQGWKEQIKGLVSNGKVKQAEIDAVGLNDYLDLQQGKVTKDQVVSFLKENGVQVTDVTLGSAEEATAITSAVAVDRISAGKPVVWVRHGDTGTDGMVQMHSTESITDPRSEYRKDVEAGLAEWRTGGLDVGGQPVGDTKFASYQLPGGENYRELLLTLPPANHTNLEVRTEGDISRLFIKGTEQLVRAFRSRADAERHMMVLSGSTGKDFQSSHYDQPNILAHIRFNERTDAQGKRVLFLEEIQSDWAQKGRKEGFASKETELPNRPASHSDIVVNDNIRGWGVVQAIREVAGKKEFDVGGLWIGEDKFGLDKVTDRNRNDILSPGVNTRRVPSGPFVSKTEAWTALALKRMIRYAAENGFDKVAWTTGEQQAARYDLSKQVNRVEVSRPQDGSYAVYAYQNKTDTVPAIQTRVATESELADLLGKDFAAKVAKQPVGTKRDYSGLDLKVGGEGMKGYYDKIVPSVANEILRKLGGGKVESVQTNTTGDGKYGVWLPDIEGFHNRTFSRNWEAGKFAEQIGGEVREIPNTLAQPGFTITPELADRAANGLPLFSKAATEMNTRFAAGELELMQQFQAVTQLTDNAMLHKNDTLKRLMLGPVADDIKGSVTRWWMKNISTPNYIAAFSTGYKNVMHTLNRYIEYRETLIERLLHQQMPEWYHADFADQDAASNALLDRTIGKWTTDSQEYKDMYRALSDKQKALFDGANRMIAGFLDAELAVDAKDYKRYLTTPGAYDKWLADRTTQVQEMKANGYVPLRRYGDHTVRVYKTIQGKDGKEQQLEVKFEAFQHEAQAIKAAEIYKDEFKRQDAPYTVEVGIKHKTARDTTISVQQYLDTARRNGVEISTTERERLVLALTASESMVRNRLMMRSGMPGFARDGMRILNEFGVNMSGKIAYSEFGTAIDAAAEGRNVEADVVGGQPVIQIDYPQVDAAGVQEAAADYESRNLWKQDGPKSGFYQNMADQLSDYVLVPDHTGGWSRNLRGAAMTYFIGGSISGAMVNTMSVPMMLVPQLSAHTNYINGLTAAMSAWKMTWQHQAILRDVTRLRNLNRDPKNEIPGMSPELRAALLAASDKLMDTELHQIMSISQGQFFSQSRRVQKAMEVWMSPFRVSEQTNRITSFIAAYNVGKENGLKDQALFNFARDMVDSTQNNYSACVDTETECLTEAGWKRFDAMQPGERMYGVDDHGNVVNTIGRHVNIFPGEHRVLSFANKNGFRMITTGNHDCLIQSYNSRDKKWQRLRKQEAGKLKSSHHLLRVPLGERLGRTATYSDDFVELLAWVASEGSYGKIQTPGQIGDVKISQSISHNPEYVANIERLLIRLGGHYRRYDDPPKTHPNGRPHHMALFTVQNPLSWKIRAALPDKQVTADLVSQLTPMQMRLFLAVFAMGDGHLGDFGGPVITQKSQENIDSLQMMATLAGVSSTSAAVTRQDYTHLYINIEKKRSHVKALSVSESMVDTVWCPTTDCGTWIARRNGRVFVTGNSNRPGAARDPVFALMFMFKSFPLFMTEAMHLMYKENPKSAVFMLLGLTAMTGVQGLPFAETILDLIDTISQQLFGSAFNSRRAMRNVIKSASEAFSGYDASDLVMRGMLNEIAGISAASRIGAGDFVPGSRLGTADADEGKILSQFAGAPYAMLKNTVANIGDVARGIATGDWKQTVDALRAGGPIAVRNVIKGAEQLSEGYASDSKGRKIVDVSTLSSMLQMTGLAPAAVARAYDLESINIQTKAFYTQVSQDMQAQLINALRKGDTEKVQEINALRNKWNEAYPTMPIMPNAAAVRRGIMLAGVPLDQRSLMQWSRRMRGENVFTENMVQ